MKMSCNFPLTARYFAEQLLLIKVKVILQSSLNNNKKILAVAKVHCTETARQQTDLEF